MGFWRGGGPVTKTVNVYNTVITERFSKRFGIPFVKIARLTFAHLLLLMGVFVMMTPFIWSFTTSFKELRQVFGTPWFYVPWPLNFAAYEAVFNRIAFVPYLLNTFKVAFLITAGQLITCSLAGYAFARLRFPGRDQLFLAYLATMMIPGIVTMIPNFVIMRNLGWVDSHMALVVPFLGSAYGTFLMRQFFLSFPSELEDAARLDGCNPLLFYLHILLPNSKPILATFALITFQWAWNDFQWPLIIINSDSKRTLQVGLSFLQNINYTEWNVLMAASLLAILPIIILFLFTQKSFVSSIKLSGIKG
jgi:multiple sugar transport system permease protein